jgi:predicted tellurium resistance membrane protein TerC
LRTFFFLLADVADRFHFLKIGLAFILSFIGVKMLLPLLAEGLIMITGRGSTSAIGSFAERFAQGDFKDAVINISLGVVVLSIAVSIVASLIFPPKHDKSEDSDPPDELEST